MSRNEKLNEKFDKLVVWQKLKRNVNKYIERGEIILSIINDIKPSGEYDQDLIKAFTEGGAFVLANKSSDPTAVNGGIYYNSSTNKVRICEAGTWKNIV